MVQPQVRWPFVGRTYHASAGCTQDDPKLNGVFGRQTCYFGIPQCKQTLVEPTGTLLELLTTTAMSLLRIVLARTRSRTLVLEDVF